MQWDFFVLGRMLAVPSVYVNILIMKETSKESQIFLSWTKHYYDCHLCVCVCACLNISMACFVCTYICGCKLSLYGVHPFCTSHSCSRVNIYSCSLLPPSSSFFIIFQQFTLCFTGAKGALNVHKMPFCVYTVIFWASVCKHVHTLSTAHTAWTCMPLKVPVREHILYSVCIGTCQHVWVCIFMLFHACVSMWVPA